MTKVLVCLLVLATMGSAQEKKAAPCNDAQTFCWYDSEVIAQGNRWVTQDTKDTLEVSITFRCVKSLNICIRARSYHQVLDKSLIVTNVELLPITRWDENQITANAENYEWEPCERNSYMINRTDRTILMISSPGPKSDTSDCTAVHGKPRTITYRLSQ